MPGFASGLKKGNRKTIRKQKKMRGAGENPGLGIMAFTNGTSFSKTNANKTNTGT